MKMRLLVWSIVLVGMLAYCLPYPYFDRSIYF